MKYVYEVIDHTCEEQPYYSIGIFNSLKEAENYLRSLEMPIGYDDFKEWQTFFILKRKLNEADWPFNILDKAIVRADLIKKEMPEDYDGDDIWELKIERKNENE